MEFNDLHCVLALGKHSDLGLAAKEAGIAENELLGAVQRHEQELGEPLFNTLGKEYRLTYTGERYIEKAQQIMYLKRELEQEINDIRQRDVGELKIAFPIMRGTYMLPCTLPVFSGKYPNVKVTVHEANSEAIEEMLLAGETDLAFFTLPIRSEEIVHKVIKEEEVVLVLSPQHPLANIGVNKPDCRYPWVDIRRFRDEPFILQKRDQRTRHIGERLFDENGMAPWVAVYVRNILASVQLAANGYGVTLVGESHMRHIKTDVEPVCFSVGRPCTKTSFVAAWRRGAYLPQFAREYIDIVQEFT